MSTNRELVGRALILASGSSTPDADTFIKNCLSDFVHEVLEVQRIDLAGHTIVALHIAIDPAHFEAISNELESSGKEKALDIAMELI